MIRWPRQLRPVRPRPTRIPITQVGDIVLCSFAAVLGDTNGNYCVLWLPRSFDGLLCRFNATRWIIHAGTRRLFNLVVKGIKRKKKKNNKILTRGKRFVPARGYDKTDDGPARRCIYYIVTYAVKQRRRGINCDPSDRKIANRQSGRIATP